MQLIMHLPFLCTTFTKFTLNVFPNYSKFLHKNITQITLVTNGVIPPITINLIDTLNSSKVSLSTISLLIISVPYSVFINLDIFRCFIYPQMSINTENKFIKLRNILKFIPLAFVVPNI